MLGSCAHRRARTSLATRWQTVGAGDSTLVRTGFHVLIGDDEPFEL